MCGREASLYPRLPRLQQPCASLIALILASLRCCGTPQYMYNLQAFGHRTYTRRDPAELSAAQKSVESRVATGELGGLSPLA